MFADSLLDSHFHGRAQRGWTTLTSFALQTLALACALMLPLLYTEGLPRLHLLSVSAPIGAPPGPPPAVEHSHAANRPIQSNLSHGLVVTPPTIPIGVSHVVDDGPLQDSTPCTVCVPGAIPGVSSTNSVINSIGNTMPIVTPPPPTSRPPRLSTIMTGNLIYRVQPIYPPLARAARIQGAVVLRAIISRTGAIENLQTVSGHPMLVGAAVDAVRQWRYRPYLLNGDPVEVETQVTVNFSLTGG